MALDKLKMVHLLLIISTIMSLNVSCDKKTDDSNAKADSPQQKSVQLLPQDKPLPQKTITLGGQKFNIELAYQRFSRSRGLMFRKELAENAGMLFIFTREQERTFWMKNCLIDLDVLFINSELRIVDIQTMKAPMPNRPLLNYTSRRPAKYALELKSGSAKRLDLRIGQNIDLGQSILKIIPEAE